MVLRHREALLSSLKIELTICLCCSYICVLSSSVLYIMLYEICYDSNLLIAVMYLKVNAYSFIAKFYQ